MEVAASPGTSENTGSQIFFSCYERLEVADIYGPRQNFFKSKFIKSGKYPFRFKIFINVLMKFCTRN